MSQPASSLPASHPQKQDIPGLVSLVELADGRACTPLLDDAGQVVDPLLIVDLDTETDAATDPVLLRAAREGASAAERILVGVRRHEAPGDPWHEMLAALDLTLSPLALSARPLARGMLRSCVPSPDPLAQAHLLRATAATYPQAALVLAQVLRASEGLDVRSALDVESFAYSTLLGGAEFRRWLAGRGDRPPPPSAQIPPVLVERAADRLLITLNLPERRNAYGRQLRDALVDALRVAALDDTAGPVIIAGVGPSFCAGGDLDEFGTTPDIATAHFVRTRGGAGELLHRIADRTEVRLHGACVGAGIELAAFAGRVVAQAGTTIRLPEVSMGLIPGAGGTVSIPRRMGRWRTLYLALSGASLDAQAAARWGLVDSVDRE